MSNRARVSHEEDLETNGGDDHQLIIFFNIGQSERLKL